MSSGLLVVFALFPVFCFANHPWSNFHWKLTNYQTKIIPVYDSLTDAYEVPSKHFGLNFTLEDWSVTGLDRCCNDYNGVSWSGGDTSIHRTCSIPPLGQLSGCNLPPRDYPIGFEYVSRAEDIETRQNCPAVSMAIRACNADYNQTGWAGVASVWLNGLGEVVQGTAKMNDYYMASRMDYSKQMVLCQEIGHLFGIGHQSTLSGSSGDRNTCMDYSWDSTFNSRPNSHDYFQLFQQHETPSPTPTISITSSISPTPSKTSSITSVSSTSSSPSPTSVPSQTVSSSISISQSIVSSASYTSASTSSSLSHTSEPSSVSSSSPSISQSTASSVSEAASPSASASKSRKRCKGRGCNKNNQIEMNSDGVAIDVESTELSLDCAGTPKFLSFAEFGQLTHVHRNRDGKITHKSYKRKFNNGCIIISDVLLAEDL